MTDRWLVRCVASQVMDALKFSELLRSLYKTIREFDGVSWAIYYYKVHMLIGQAGRAQN